MTTSSVDLQSLLEDKFQEWERVRLVEDCEAANPSADEILEELLRGTTGNHIYFVSGTGVSGSIQSFRSAYDNAKAWSAYELELQDELSDEQLTTMPFSSLVGGLAR